MHPTAARFHALNAGKPMLLLRNVWDAGGAGLLQTVELRRCQL